MAWGKEEFQYNHQAVIHAQLNACREAGNVEFRGGYTEIRETVVNGQIVKEENYVPDTRQVFINSVSMLRILCNPVLTPNTIKNLEKIYESFSVPEEKTDQFYNELVKLKKQELTQLVDLIHAIYENPPNVRSFDIIEEMDDEDEGVIDESSNDTSNEKT